MKIKYLLSILIFALCTTLMNAQNPFKGFFEPKNQAVSQALSVPLTLNTTNTWLFRPAASLTAIDVTIKNGVAVTQPFGAAGVGLEYGEYTTVNGSAYCLVAVDALLITNYSLNNTSFTGLGGALTIKAFNLASLGIGYVNNSVHILAGITYNF